MYCLLLKHSHSEVRPATPRSSDFSSTVARFGITVYKTLRYHRECERKRFNQLTRLLLWEQSAASILMRLTLRWNEPNRLHTDWEFCFPSSKQPSVYVGWKVDSVIHCYFSICSYQPATSVWCRLAYLFQNIIPCQNGTKTLVNIIKIMCIEWDGKRYKSTKTWY